MASYTLYPPIVDSQMAAFSGGECPIYFSLSKFNSSSDFGSVHISIVEQVSNKNYVNTALNGDEDSFEGSGQVSTTRFRSTGIILNANFSPVEGEENLYKVIIREKDVATDSSTQKTVGWTMGQTYKVQLRLVEKNVYYSGSATDTTGQAEWLKNNASSFSEWSTVCIIKATGEVDYTIPSLDIGSAGDTRQTSSENITTFYMSTLELFGSFKRTDRTEYVKSYQFILYDYEDNQLDDSGIIFMDSNKNDIDSFNYVSKYELEDNKKYRLSFKFETEHGWVGGFYKSGKGEEVIDHRYVFTISLVTKEIAPCEVLTVDNDSTGLVTSVSSVDKEEDEGRIGLKLFRGGDDNDFNGNLCIRRADARTDFKVWTDIKIYVCNQQPINELPMIYDYTIESGVWYKYGVQIIDQDGNRGILNQMSIPIMRNFNYSFLLGKDNRQVKLMFDNSMPNFKYQVAESRVDPISSVYPIVTRNATTMYRTFPINGLISFWMDENNVLASKREIMGSKSMTECYNQYKKDNPEIVQYDYIYEKKFRDEVLKFLYDGEFKIFKSPTEGNIIVRLMDINCVPNQSLDRMLYSFSANAFEMDDNTMENYLKYGFYDPGKYATEFITYSTRIGQIQIDAPIGYNILEAIYNKYDSKGQNMGGYIRTLGDVYSLRITFDGKPMRVINNNASVNSNTDTNNTLVLGYNFQYRDGRIITVQSPHNMYEFDEKLKFNPTTDKLIILGPAVDDIEAGQTPKITTVSITVDFLYELANKTYQGKPIKSQTVKNNMGEFFMECNPGTNIYNEIYLKYGIEWDKQFRRLNRITSIEIEANPGTVFYIEDASDGEGKGNEFIIGYTGKLRLYELNDIIGFKYIGVKKSDGTLDKEMRQDIMVKYIVVVSQGIYK